MHYNHCHRATAYLQLNILLLLILTTGSQYRDMLGTHPESCLLGTGGPFGPTRPSILWLPGFMSPARSGGRDMKHTIRLQIVKNVWSYNSTPL
jgi:hypothetical protein